MTGVLQGNSEKIILEEERLPWWLRHWRICLQCGRPRFDWSLGREDPLEKEMATHSSILAWRIPWTEEQASVREVHGVTKSLIHFVERKKNHQNHLWSSSSHTKKHEKLQNIDEVSRKQQSSGFGCFFNWAVFIKLIDGILIQCGP